MKTTKIQAKQNVAAIQVLVLPLTRKKVLGRLAKGTRILLIPLRHPLDKLNLD